MEKQKTKYKRYYTTIDGVFESFQQAQKVYGWSEKYNGVPNINKIKKYRPLELTKVVVKGSEPLLEYKWHPKFTEYCVDTDGNVFRYTEQNGYHEITPHINGKVGVNKSNIIGYATIQPYLNGKRHMIYHHRFVAETWIPNPENKRCVNHLNEVKWDNRVENLQWVTYKANSKHSHKRLLGPKETAHTWVLSYKGKNICQDSKISGIARKSGLAKNVVVYIIAISNSLDAPVKSKYRDYDIVKIAN